MKRIVKVVLVTLASVAATVALVVAGFVVWYQDNAPALCGLAGIAAITTYLTIKAFRAREKSADQESVVCQYGPASAPEAKRYVGCKMKSGMNEKIANFIFYLICLSAVVGLLLLLLLIIVATVGLRDWT